VSRTSGRPTSAASALGACTLGLGRTQLADDGQPRRDGFEPLEVGREARAHARPDLVAQQRVARLDLAQRAHTRLGEGERHVEPARVPRHTEHGGLAPQLLSAHALTGRVERLGAGEHELGGGNHELGSRRVLIEQLWEHDARALAEIERHRVCRQLGEGCVVRAERDLGDEGEAGGVAVRDRGADHRVRAAQLRPHGDRALRRLVFAEDGRVLGGGARWCEEHHEQERNHEPPPVTSTVTGSPSRSVPGLRTIRSPACTPVRTQACVASSCATSMSRSRA
jgi:hypothetical protein